MKTKSKSELSLKDKTFSKLTPRVLQASNENEGEARLYTKRGRLILPAQLLRTFKLDKKKYFELFFDRERKIIAINFVDESKNTYKVPHAKGGSCFVELRGPFKGEGFKIKETEKPVVIKIHRQPNEGFLYFSYESLVEQLERKIGRQKG